MVAEVSDVEWVTIDQLAQSSAVTVRNIRAYQARGLLPPPQVRARTGYYGPGHEARLDLIKDLQGEGLKLDAIRKLFDATGGSTEQVLHFIRTVRQLFGDEERQIVDRAELAERFGTSSPSLLRRAEKLGLLRQVADDQYEEVSPRLTRAGQALVELGVPLDRSLVVVEHLRRHAEGIAKVYVQLFLDEIWKPFEAEGRPDDQWERVHDTIHALRDIAGEALLAVLEVAVSERIDVTFGREVLRNVRSPHDERSDRKGADRKSADKGADRKGADRRTRRRD